MASSAVPPWLDLPRDITAAILHRLGPVEILRTAELVCSAWRSVCRDPSMWRCIDMPCEGTFSEEICRCAVDRSQGQLIDVNFKYFCSYAADYLLLYISQRCSSLRRLQLIYTHISRKAIIEAVKNLPHLEELHLYYTHMEYYTRMDAETIEAIGRSCPVLKSFKLNHKWYGREPPVVCNLEAQAIAEHMSELRHLQLFGNRMTNEGVQAIINGCIHLESFDIRQCFNVHFVGDIEGICLQRIKELRRPHDPTHDYPFDIESDDDYSDYSNDTMASDYMMEEMSYDRVGLEEEFDKVMDDMMDEMMDDMMYKLHLDEDFGFKNAKSPSRKKKRKKEKHSKSRGVKASRG